MTSAACFRARLALCSPSAAITLARASLAASASAAIALINCSGTLTSFSSTLSTVTPQGSVATSKVSFKQNHKLEKCQQQLQLIFDITLCKGTFHLDTLIYPCTLSTWSSPLYCWVNLNENSPWFIKKFVFDISYTVRGKLSYLEILVLHSK